MVDAMAVLGTAAAAKLAGDRLVRDFVAYIRETGTSVSSTAQAYAASSTSRKRSARRPRKTRLSRPMKSSTSGLGRRPRSSRLSKKVSTMTDAELEAELEARRRRRAREREAYSRAMRSDKLAALESELDSLRREIGRLDPPAPAFLHRQSAGTPADARWEALPRSRRPPSAHGPTPPGFMYATMSVAAAPGGPPPPRTGGPPPPPPPPSMMGCDDDEGLTIDPEKQRREKVARQKRREAKKKEREQNQKKMTLADIIRAAGPDPASRLKPASLKPADLERQEWETAKREREEREERQEKERIENEKLVKDGPKRATERTPKKQKEEEGKTEEGKKIEEKDSNKKGTEKANDDLKFEDNEENDKSETAVNGEENLHQENNKNEATCQGKTESSIEPKISPGAAAEVRIEEKAVFAAKEMKEKAEKRLSHKSNGIPSTEKQIPTQRSDTVKSELVSKVSDASYTKETENVTPNAPPQLGVMAPAKPGDASKSPVDSQMEASS